MITIRSSNGHHPVVLEIVFTVKATFKNNVYDDDDDDDDRIAEIR